MHQITFRAPLKTLITVGRLNLAIEVKIPLGFSVGFADRLGSIED